MVRLIPEFEGGDLRARAIIFGAVADIVISAILLGLVILTALPDHCDALTAIAAVIAISLGFGSFIVWKVRVWVDIVLEIV